MVVGQTATKPWLWLLALSAVAAATALRSRAQRRWAPACWKESVLGLKIYNYCSGSHAGLYPTAYYSVLRRNTLYYDIIFLYYDVLL